MTKFFSIVVFVLPLVVAVSVFKVWENDISLQTWCFTSGAFMFIVSMMVLSLASFVASVRAGHFDA